MARSGPASDLYAFGIVLFEMCTGTVPFRGATPLDTARAQQTDQPPAPSELARLDPSWDAAILRLLSKDPHDRHASAAHVVSELEGQSQDVEPVRHSLPAERGRLRRAHRGTPDARIARLGNDRLHAASDHPRTGRHRKDPPSDPIRLGEPQAMARRRLVLRPERRARPRRDRTGYGAGPRRTTHQR